MTIYVTKYALTKGIFIHQAHLGTAGDGWVEGAYVYTSGHWALQCRLGHDAFLTEDEALAAAEKMRARKLASLAKQISKIRDLQIKVRKP